MHFPFEMEALAGLVLQAARDRSWRLASAESCTGGLIAACLTAVPGSSDVFERGYVTYSNQAKEDILEVPGDLIADHGAVSEAVARAMAEGGLMASRAHSCLAITGIAGPGGATPLKPIGRVHFAIAQMRGSILHRQVDFGNHGRQEIRAACVETALQFWLELLEANY